MSTAEVSNSPIPLARSILVKLLAMTFMCVILVVGVTEILASRTSKLIATRAVSIQVEQVVAMIADGSAAAIRFGDGEGLTKTAEAAIASSDGQILGGVFVNAAGDLLASAGDADEGLVEIARDAVTATLHGDAERSLQHGHAVVNPKTGESVGAIALKADAERLMTVAAEASREALVFGLLLLVAVLVPLYFILRAGIARPLARQAAAMAKISAGIYDFKVPDGSRRDEIGSLSQSLEIFRAYMKSTTEAAQTNLFRSAAFSQTKSAMMMVDRDRNIIEQNQACLALFMEHEPEFKKHWPDFDPEVLAGKSIDCFHSQPEHQAAILSDLGRMPYTADISVGDLKVNLQVSAILDAEGKHAGNILEWRDVGEERLHGGIVESIGQHRCYVVYNPDGMMLHANYKARDCLGLSEDEARERHFCDTFQDKAEGESILAAIRTGGSEAGKFQRRRIDDREVWTDSSVNLVIDANGDAYRIVEIANDVTEQEAARRHAESDRNRMVENQEEVVTALKKGLGALADGDLTHDIAQAFADEYEQLRADFNSATAKLRETLGQMVQVAANVKAGSEEISQASEDLSRRTEAQAATLANTATAIDELTASVRSSATGAQEADKAAEGAKHSAKSGGSVVLEAVAAMKEIEESSERIGKIIGVIEDIAFQTNLLALNAGVEAARAGDAGRGFAVVASEVRALAQRSSEAAREIKALISASSDHVAQGVALVDRTGDALEGIVGSVGNIAVQVSEIATSSQQQASGLGEINEGMMRLDSVTQQNAAMVEESTAASRTMRREAEALASLIGFFQTGSEVEDQPRSMTGKQAEASRRIPRRETVEPDSFKIAVGAEDMDIPTSSPRGSTLSDWQDF